VRVSNLTFLVAEVVGPTARAAESGDAGAFSRLYAAFKAIEARIAAAGGSPVKLHGDGVLAVFESPERGVRAALELRAALDALTPAEGDAGGASVRVGLHRGSAAAVTLNDRLDYFGRNVLEAIDLLREAEPHELWVSAALWPDPGVRDLLDRALRAEQIEAVSLEPVPRFRLRSRAL
jgi:class 3 adenylate cyclase